MSSDRIERKRRSESDFSDNSADELPAVKIRRVDSAINLREKVSEACKNFLTWITPGFLKKMVVRVSRETSASTLNMGAENSFRNPFPTEVDEDEEVSIIGAQNGTGACSKSSNTFKMDSFPRSSSSIDPQTCPLASTPNLFPFSPKNPYYNQVSRTIERKKMNGYPSRTSSRREKISVPRQGENRVAPITNPRSEFDILLGDDFKKDEVQIISEVYPTKLSSAPIRKIRLLSDPRGPRNEKARCLEDFPCSWSPYSTKSYTINEVVRLQERAQYKMLLEKVVKRTPIFKQAFPRENSQAAAIQVDLTEDDDVPNGSCHFKKEKVDANVENFLSNYFKPCALVPLKTRSPLINSQSTPLGAVAEDDDEDFIEIIECPELPKLKPIKSSCNDSYFTGKWIEQLRIDMNNETEKMYERVYASEEKVERYKKRREAKNSEEMRKREEMRLAGFIFPEDVEMEEEVLPEITPEMDAIIERALAKGNGDEELSKMVTTRNESIHITRNDISTLTNLNWLNDQVINFYLGLIENRSTLDGYLSAHCFNSFFYTKLKKEGPTRQLLRWTRKTDIFAKDLIIVPLHLDLHWALLVVDQRNKQMTYYDSMCAGETNCLKIIENYLIAEMQDKKKAALEPNFYSFEIAKDIPKQMNGSDCGMFTLKYAEYLARDAPLTFTQENMPYFRRRMVYELITKLIL